MQYNAIPCNKMQYQAIPCHIMQYHASLITGDGAYHCPVGSIWLFFSFASALYTLHTEELLRERANHPLQKRSSKRAGYHDVKLMTERTACPPSGLVCVSSNSPLQDPTGFQPAVQVQCEIYHW